MARRIEGRPHAGDEEVPVAPIARHIAYVGAPGAATPHLATLPYGKIARPKWPLDP